MYEKRYIDNFGNVIKSARVSKNMTQSELAKRLSITPRYLKAIENSGRKPSYHLLTRMIYELDISMDDMLWSKENLHGKMHLLKRVK